MSQVPACPECDTANPYKRQPSIQDLGHTHRYRCEECDHRFDEAVYRDAKSRDCIPGGSLASALDRMDPDEVQG